jgi:hypothetical protein
VPPSGADGRGHAGEPPDRAMKCSVGMEMEPFAREALPCLDRSGKNGHDPAPRAQPFHYPTRRHA